MNLYGKVELSSDAKAELLRELGWRRQDGGLWTHAGLAHPWPFEDAVRFTLEHLSYTATVVVQERGSIPGGPP